MNIESCAECGGSVAPVAMAGRTGAYRGRRFPIPEDMQIPTCAGCGTEWVTPNIIDALDRIFEPLYAQAVQA